MKMHWLLRGLCVASMSMSSMEGIAATRFRAVADIPTGSLTETRDEVARVLSCGESSARYVGYNSRDIYLRDGRQPIWTYVSEGNARVISAESRYVAFQTSTYDSETLTYPTKIGVLSTESGRLKWSLPVANAMNFHLIFVRGDWIVVPDAENSDLVRVRDMETGRELSTHRLSRSATLFTVVRMSDDTLVYVLTPNYAVSSSYRMEAIRNGKTLWTHDLPSHGSPGGFIEVQPGRLLVAQKSASPLFDVSTGSVVKRFPGAQHLVQDDEQFYLSHWSQGDSFTAAYRRDTLERSWENRDWSGAFVPFGNLLIDAISDTHNVVGLDLDDGRVALEGSVPSVFYGPFSSNLKKISDNCFGAYMGGDASESHTVSPRYVVFSLK